MGTLECRLIRRRTGIYVYLRYFLYHHFTAYHLLWNEQEQTR